MYNRVSRKINVKHLKKKTEKTRRSQHPASMVFRMALFLYARQYRCTVSLFSAAAIINAQSVSGSIVRAVSQVAIILMKY